MTTRMTSTTSRSARTKSRPAPQARAYSRRAGTAGREIVAWFDATKPGKYEWPCAELCGFGHSGMKGWVYVHSVADYEKWAAENLKSEPAPAQEEKPKS